MEWKFWKHKLIYQRKYFRKNEWFWWINGKIDIRKKLSNNLNWRIPTKMLRLWIWKLRTEIINKWSRIRNGKKCIRLIIRIAI